VLKASEWLGFTKLTAQNIEADRRWETWMVAAQAGDRAAYETLLQDCIPFIKMVARRQGVSFDRIDDVVQETLLTVHRARQTYDPSRSFAAWLRMIAQRRAIDGLRSHNRHQVREIHAPLAYENHPDTGGDPRESTDRSDRTAVLALAVETLPARQREAVRHLALSGLSLAEAATATGRTMGALKVNFHRALKTLRTDLVGEE
jgi:RNA polymerase sigma factor (sigma-70 family)